jgi:hypothetical protein
MFTKKTKALPIIVSVLEAVLVFIITSTTNQVF